MTKVTLSYFDFPGGRGEDCRLALHLAGVPFEDDRVKGPQWPERKAATPFGAMPVLEIEGKGKLAQSNVILRYIGHEHGLHPTDAWTAAQHEALMGAVEDLRGTVSAVLRVQGEGREAARKELASGPMQAWARNVEPHIEGPFVAGDRLYVVDLKLFVLMKWFVSGSVDHVPPDVFADFPKLTALYQAVEQHPKVRDWYGR